MSIGIYTYSNPYKLKSEKIWAQLKNSFQLCGSQTLVNGLCDFYNDDFFIGQLTTISNFIDSLYNGWMSNSLLITQLAAVDNLIESLDYNDFADFMVDEEAIVSSLRKNRVSICQAIRIMFEMDMIPSNIKQEYLTDEQKIIVKMYTELYDREEDAFRISKNISKEEVETAIRKTIETAYEKSAKKKKRDLNNVQSSIVVIHGIHQFTPIMLRAIEQLAKYKLVMIIFQYQPDYKNVYETWLDVYSCFEEKINISEHNLKDNDRDDFGGYLANHIAALVNGDTTQLATESRKIEVIQFDNTTEFAGYIAKIFEEAEQERKADNLSHNNLFYMREKFYAADSSVNQLLKLYFPEQFGERQFLDYPLGHFFVSITNMWDMQSKTLIIREMDDVLECLSCGIIKESKKGILSSVFNKTRLYFEDCDSLSSIISRLKRLRKNISKLEDDSINDRQIKRLDYFTALPLEIDELIKGLSDLDSITEMFYSDFNDSINDFRSFYQKIKNLLESNVMFAEDVSEEFKSIVLRVLKRIDEVKDIKAKASFDCLRQSMQLYLQQIPDEGLGANWIVKNFEQVDGDVLVQQRSGKECVYHFACLSDLNINVSRKMDFPWPLDMDFFEIAQDPADWKYQTYVRSRMEYKNYKRYALVYGLEFCRSKVVLSYIKNEKDTVSDMYYLLRILGAESVPYSMQYQSKQLKNARYISFEDIDVKKSYSINDLMKYRLCRYRFLLDSLIAEDTIYRDSFLLKKYVEVMLENRAFIYFANKNYNENMILTWLHDEADDLKKYFRFMLNTEWLDVINNAAEYIRKSVKYRFKPINDELKLFMINRELLLAAKLNNKERNDEVFKKASQYEVDDTLNTEALAQEKYLCSWSELCNSCGEKNLCLESYRQKSKGDIS